jgi:hypothetical protein
MAKTAERSGDRVMKTSVTEAVRASSVPVAIIGVGAAWLLMKRRSAAASRWRTGDYRRSREANAYDNGGSDWGREAEASVVGTTGYADYVSAPAGDAARELGGERGPDSRRMRRSVNVERVLRDNALLVGAAAALVGVAIGLSRPAARGDRNRATPTPG